MAIYLITKRARELLIAFNSRIAQTEQFGRIDNWKAVADGQSYTHTADEWTGKAHMVPRIEEDRLVFNIAESNSHPASAAAYSFYHAQMLQAFLRNLDLYYDMIKLSPRCADGDNYA